MIHKMLRRASVVCGVLFLSVGVARALDAECVSPDWDPDEIVCEHCGQTACCYTHWHGDQLISTWCIEHPT